MKTAIIALLFAQVIFAGEFKVYPGSIRNPDPAHGNPNHAISYRTSDGYKQVVDFYKKTGRLAHEGPGFAEINFQSGGGVLIRDAQAQGTLIVVDHRTKLD
jgi:hypothetical protein